MLGDWEEREELVAAGSICPVPNCGALVISYRPQDRAERDHANSWCEFACTRCGTEFTAPEDELFFQSVPKEWLLARVQAAWPRRRKGVTREKQCTELLEEKEG